MIKGGRISFILFKTFAKEDKMRRKIKRILSIWLCILVGLTSSVIALYANASSENSENEIFNEMLERAETIVNYEWVPTQRIDVWNENPYNGKMYFEAGETVVGMPYTLFTREIVSDSLLSLEQYKNVVSSNYSATAKCYSVNNYPERTGPVFGSCCATFVSEVFGGKFMLGADPRYDGIGGIQSSPYGTTITNVKLSDVKLGDALSESGGSHIIWVGGMTEDTITIYEQTPPVARKVTINKSSVTSDGYLIYNYKSDGSPYIYNVVTRSDDLLDGDSGYEQSDKYSVPIYSFTVNTGKTLVYKTINGEAKVNKIYDTDLCTINKLYSNGWCHVKFPLDAGGYDTGYVNTSVFFDFDAEKKEFYIPNQTETYSRSNLVDDIGYVGAGDTVYLLNQTETAVQVMYPLITGGYKVGWISISAVNYTLSYNANGGINPPTNQNASIESQILISTDIPERSGYTFLGWSESASSSLVSLQPGDPITLNSDLTLYAVWRKDQSQETVLGDVNGDGIVNSSDVSVLRTYLVNFDYIEGKSTVTVSPGADINGDGVINGKDLIRLRKFIKE